MLRLAALLAVLVLVALPRPAHADITAEYYVWGPIGPTMKVQVADNGNARVEMGGHLTAIQRDGVLYLVRADDAGSFVFRKDEFDRIEAEMLDPDLFPTERAQGVRIVEAGEETVGGRRGIALFLEEPGDPARDQERDQAFVVSPDDDLRPVGALVAQIWGGPMTPGALPRLQLMADIHARGTLIRMPLLLRLERTNNEPIPPAAFELPGPIVSGDEARARLGRAW